MQVSDMTFLFRLKHAKVVLEIATELDEWLNTVEGSLVDQHGITMTAEDLNNQYEELEVSRYYWI